MIWREATVRKSLETPCVYSRRRRAVVSNAGAELLARRSIIGSHPQANGASAPTRLNIDTVF